MSSGTVLGAGSGIGPFPIDEVQAAVRALRDGQFKNARPTWRQQSASPTAKQLGGGALPVQPSPISHGIRRGGDAPRWVPTPGERVLPVIASSGSCGASTLALAVAMTARIPARVIECCSASASGLAAASTAELGLHLSGWRHGRRDQVLLERASDVLAGVDEVPAPTDFDAATRDDATPFMTVLDIGWEIGQLVSIDSWVRDAVARADNVLVVALATVPGIRRLEVALELLAQNVTSPDRAFVAVRGPRRKKWPRGLQHAGGPQTRRALGDGALIEVPEDRALSMSGLGSRPLPPQLLAAASRVHDHIDPGDQPVDHLDASPVERPQIERP